MKEYYKDIHRGMSGYGPALKVSTFYAIESILEKGYVIDEDNPISAPYYISAKDEKN